MRGQNFFIEQSSHDGLRALQDVSANIDARTNVLNLLDRILQTALSLFPKDAGMDPYSCADHHDPQRTEDTPGRKEQVRDVGDPLRRHPQVHHRGWASLHRQLEPRPDGIGAFRRLLAVEEIVTAKVAVLLTKLKTKFTLLLLGNGYIGDLIT